MTPDEAAKAAQRGFIEGQKMWAELEKQTQVVLTVSTPGLLPAIGFCSYVTALGAAGRDAAVAEMLRTLRQPTAQPDRTEDF